MHPPIWLDELERTLPPDYDELRPFSKSAQKDGVFSATLGLVRRGTRLSLYLLHYDEAAYHEEQALERRPAPSRPLTHRDMLSWHRDPCPVPAHLTGAVIGGQTLPIEQCSMKSASLATLLLVQKMMEAGWQAPSELRCADFFAFRVLEVGIQGEFDAIPPLSETDKTEISFRRAPRSVKAKKRLTLEVGGRYPRKHLCGAGEGAVPFYINGFYLYDLAGESMRRYEDPALLGRFSPEELAELRAQALPHLRSICPEGMLIPVIEYETPDRTQLDFYARSYLDAVPISKNGSAAIFGMSDHDRPTGLHGLPLRFCALHDTPVPPDTAALEVELVRYWPPVPEEDAVLELS